MVVVLDTFLTSSVSKRPGIKKSAVSEQCHRWINECELPGHRVLAPAISYYEVLRELEQRQATSQIARLKYFCLQSKHFLPLTTAQLEIAAQLWERPVEAVCQLRIRKRLIATLSLQHRL